MDSPTGSSCGSTNSDHPILPKKRDTPIAYLTRCETFSAGHRLHNSSLDETTNRGLFGKCTNFHGHNYKVEVTVKGPVNKISGMVMDVGELRDIMTMVIEPLDHRHLDQDIDYFQMSGKVATAENIAIFLWNKIKKLLPNETTLTNLRLHETDKHFVEYKGELEDDSLDPGDG